MTLLGYHIGALQLRDRQGTLEQLRRTRSNWHLVMDDKDYAREVRKTVQKGVVYRAFDPFAEGGKQDFDNHVWVYHTAAELAVWMDVHLGDMKQDFYLTAGNNEPSTSPGNRRQFIQWLIDLMHELQRRGIHGAIGEIAVAKTLEINEIQAGWWDEFLDVLYDYRDWHIVTFHEYTTGLVPATQMVVNGKGYPYNLTEKLVANRDLWQPRLPTEGYPGNYHIGRWHWLRTRALEIGKPIQRVVITECSYDIMVDPGAPGAFIENVLKPMFPVGRFERVKGWVGHRPYWQWLLDNGNEFGWQQLMFDSVRWHALAYPDEVEGLCQFSLKEDWYETEGVDLSHPEVAHFRYLIENNPVIRTSQPPQEQPMEAIQLTGYNEARQEAVNVNIRESRSTTSRIVGVLPAYPVVTNGKVGPVDVEPSNGYLWRQVELQLNGTTVTGYVAANFVKEVSVLFYDLALPGQPTLRMTERERDVLVMALHALGDYLTSIPGQP